jgi:hypothetical protein
VKKIIFIVLFCKVFSLPAQDNAAYVKSHAVTIDRPETLSDTIYSCLAPYRLVMMGEMHGTNESAAFVNGLVHLLTRNGDSVLLGIEIPSGKMNAFESQPDDLGIYQCDFFRTPSVDGRSSMAWQTLLINSTKNQRVKIFFFDINDGEAPLYQRDSVMASKIYRQYSMHPGWKIVTLSGNFHNKITDARSMTYQLMNEVQYNLSGKICALNIEYTEGTCTADFGNGLETKQLGSYPSVYNSTLQAEKYFLLVSPDAGYEYSGFFFTRTISAAIVPNR